MTAEDMAMEIIGFINSELEKEDITLQKLNQKRFVITPEQFQKEHSMSVGSIRALHIIAQKIKNLNIQQDDTKFMYKGKR